MKRMKALVIFLYCILFAQTYLYSSANGDLVFAAKKEVRVWMWDAHSTQMWKDWFSYLKRTFEQRHPGVELKIELVPWGADKLTLAITGGVAPDVSIASVAYAHDLFRAGGLMALNEYVEKTPDLKPETMFPFTQLFNQFGGKIYGISNSLEALSIVYNVDMLEEAGLNSDPFAMATWDDFLLYSKKLTKLGGDGKISRAGCAVGMDISLFIAWLQSNGGSFYDKTFSRAAFNTKNGAEVLSFVRDLVHTHKVGIWGWGESVLPQGKAAISYMETAPVTMLEAAPDLNFRVTSFPLGPSGRTRGSLGWANMYVIPKGAKNPDLGWEYIKHYLSIESQTQQFKILGFPFSPRRDFYATDAWREGAKRAPWMMTVPHIFTVSAPYPFIWFTTVNPKVAPLLSDCVYNYKISPQEALLKMEQMVNQELSKK